MISINNLISAIVVGLMKMGNIVLRAALKPTFLEFQSRVLPLHHISFSDVTTMHMPTCLCIGESRLLQYYLLVKFVN